MKNKAGILILFLADITTLVGISYLSFIIRKWGFPYIFEDLPEVQWRLNTYYWIFLIWLFVFIYEGGYTRRFTFWDEVKFIWKSVFLVSLVIFSIFFIGKQGAGFSRGIILTMLLFSFLILPVVRPLIKQLIYYLGFMKNVLIIGAGDVGRLALHALRREKNLGYRIVGFVDDLKDSPRMVEGIKVHRGIHGIERYIRRCNIDDVVIAKPDLKKSELINIINKVQHKVQSILYIPDISGIAVLGTELRHFFYEKTMVLEIKNNLEQLPNYLIKRFFDYTVSLMLLPILLFLIVIISLIIRMTSKGPAIFKQHRVGKDGRLFVCYKFRTMYIDAEERLKNILENDPEKLSEWKKYWKLRDDPRITGVGRFLRKTSLDELPQIFNVLKGEMSLVGPRPYLPQEKAFLKEHWEAILSVPPGITGLWQVSGRSNTSYQYRLDIDAWYVRNWNLWLDVVILLKTVKVVFRREGAY